jgi:beta-xylosidase
MSTSLGLGQTQVTSKDQQEPKATKGKKARTETASKEIRDKKVRLVKKETLDKRVPLVIKARRETKVKREIQGPRETKARKVKKVPSGVQHRAHQHLLEAKQGTNTSTQTTVMCTNGMVLHGIARATLKGPLEQRVRKESKAPR